MSLIFGFITLWYLKLRFASNTFRTKFPKVAIVGWDFESWILNLKIRNCWKNIFFAFFWHTCSFLWFDFKVWHSMFNFRHPWKLYEILINMTYLLLFAFLQFQSKSQWNEMTSQFTWKFGSMHIKLCIYSEKVHMTLEFCPC